jgi:hypothetical protein
LTSADHPRKCTLKAKSFDFRDDLERAPIKTCFADNAGTPRLPSDRPTLLVIVGDLELGMQEPGGEFSVKRSLYYQPSMLPLPLIAPGTSSPARFQF